MENSQTFINPKKSQYKRIALHILFWVVILVVNLFLYSYSNGKYKKIFLALLTTLPFDIIATYITLYYFIPKYLLNRKYFKFSIYFILSVIVVVSVERFINLYIVYPYIYLEPIEKTPPFFSVGIFFLAINIYKIVILATVIKLIKIWYQNQKLQHKLKNLNLNSELAQLRNQINPHFLFNTLNNIDALISKDKEKASDAIIKLSEIMRYMLYEASLEKVSLEKEINYLKSYINLQKLRFKDKNFVTCTYEGNFQGKLVVPMLFVSFIENAFKHGLKKTNEPSIIIKLLANEQYVQFECINYISDNQHINKDKTGGIGMSNVIRRLELLYPDKHELRITTEKGVFKVSLKIAF